MEWVPMRKGVGYPFRYREVCLAANTRYLNVLAVVANPTQAKQDLNRLTTAQQDAAGRTSAAPSHCVGDICRLVLDHLPVGFDLSFFAGREFDRSRAILDLHGALEHRHLCAA